MTDAIIRDERIVVRFRPHERHLIESAAARQHRQLSDFVRAVLVEASIDAMTGESAEAAR